MFSNIKYLIVNEIMNPIRELFYSLVFGSKKITPVYSVEGLLTKMQFLITIITLSCIYSIFEYFHNSLLNYIVKLFLFYAVLTATQKRCRDFNSSGTLWILVISSVFIGNMAFHLIDTQLLNTFMKNFNIIIFDVQVVVFLLLFFIPSKPEPDLELRTPLLKYPLLYVFTCWVLAIITTLVVNHYIGVDINLF